MEDQFDLMQLSDSLRSALLLSEAIDTRLMLEHAWSPETAYQGIALQPKDVPSRGQCGVSSLYYALRMQERGFDMHFVEGVIHIDGYRGEHVWAQEQGNGHEPTAIDLTSDQYRTLRGTSIHIGLYEDHPGIGYYEPVEYFKPDKVPHKKMLARFALLQANIANLPRRHKRHTQTNSLGKMIARQGAEPLGAPARF